MVGSPTTLLILTAAHSKMGDMGSQRDAASWYWAKHRAGYNCLGSTPASLSLCHQLHCYSIELHTEIGDVGLQSGSAHCNCAVHLRGG